MSKRKKKVTVKHNTTAELPEKKYVFGGYVLLALLVFIIYGKAINFDFAIDDKIIIVENAYANTGLAGFSDLFKAAVNHDLTIPGVTRPVTMFTHALDVSLFGLNPGWHHQMNVLYYILLIFLLFGLLRNHLLPNHSILFSLGIILLYTVHPVHVESVANIKGRDDILCFIFGALSLIYLFRYLKGRKILHQILSLTFVALSFLSKESGIVFAVLAPLTYYYFSRSNLKKTFRATYSYLILGAVLIAVRLLLFKDPA